MRNLLSNGQSTIVRDLILLEDLDRPEVKMIDFTWGTGSMWKTKWPYKFTRIRCDAVPTEAKFDQVMQWILVRAHGPVEEE